MDVIYVMKTNILRDRKYVPRTTPFVEFIRDHTVVCRKIYTRPYYN